VNTGLHEGLVRGLAEERKAVVENFESPDVREGVDAFLTGRRPDFRG
jgi:enoyl-CoA hydratase/carnithine racemase